MQNKFLHNAMPTYHDKREIEIKHADKTCKRCDAAEETQKHGLFSCIASQKVFIYGEKILEDIYFMEGPFDNVVEECLINPILNKKTHKNALLPQRDILETYFITIRNLRRNPHMTSKQR